MDEPNSATENTSDPEGFELGELSRADLEALVKSQRGTICVLSSLTQDQQQVITGLVRRVAELEKLLGIDGPGPPAGAVKRSPPSKPSNKKRKKRTKQFTRQRSAPTDKVDHFPETCPDCGRSLKDGSPCWSREVIDFNPVPVCVIEHVMYSRWCGVCKKRVVAKGDFSGLVSGRRRFGHNLTSWIACLHTEARVPLRTIQSILKRLYSVHVSVGEMKDLLELVAKKGEVALDAIKEEIRSSDCKHADETGWRENGEYRCLWSLSTALSRWFHIDPHRSSDVISRLLGTDNRGTLVTDFYYAYNQIPGPISVAGLISTELWISFG